MNKHKGSEFNWDEWRQALDEARAAKAEVVPAGYLNLKQLAQIWGTTDRPLSEPQTRKLANTLAESGKAERDKFNRLFHYRLLK